MLAVDGTEPQELRKMMQLEIDNQAEYEDNIPKVFESAGGFAPTIGIIGAVLGLIQVMQHLDNINEVGKGIAVAFVATVYGVGSANLFFLPSSGKLRIRIREEQVLREMTLEGVVSILEGMNPRMLETKLVGLSAETRRTNESVPQGAMPMKHGRRSAPITSATNAGWSPMPTLSPCCSPSSWCCTPRRRSTRQRAGRLSAAIDSAFQQLGIFRDGQATSRAKIDPSKLAQRRTALSTPALAQSAGAAGADQEAVQGHPQRTGESAGRRDQAQ